MELAARDSQPGSDWGEMISTTIYTARRVITMNPANPQGPAVAVRDGRVLGVGSVDELSAWGDCVVDDQFADKVIMPGFIEAHSHSGAGAMWAYTYVGYFDRRAPDGVVWAGCKSIADIVARLKEVSDKMAADGADDDRPLLAWGLDPIYYEGERLYAKHLDEVSEVRPVYVNHASFHLATVNSATMRLADITADTMTPGVDKDSDGQPNGELQEPAAMGLASGPVGFGMFMGGDDSLWNYGYEARNAGHTLVTDLAGGHLEDERVEQLHRVVDDPEFPVRMMMSISFGRGQPKSPAELAERAVEVKENEQTDKLRFGIVKLVLDGSIQGFTARLGWPHYYDAPPGHPGNGLWLLPPETAADTLFEYHHRGLTVHCHCNGDEASEVFIDAVERVLERHPRFDHRHTVQHCQLTTKAQYRRMAALGMYANIFSNHMFYWGDQHRALTVGPERAEGMDACATALREGVPFSIHSDAPVTPLGHLHVAWCAVNRLTASGEVLGENERITVDDALHACTIGAALQLNLDHEMGSIEAGKLADFAVLDDDPYAVDPKALKDIGVWGTVLGGVPRQAPRG